MPLIYGVVRCVAGQVWWAALCQKVQGHFLAPVRPWWRVVRSGSGSGIGRVVCEAGTPGMGNGLVLARAAGLGLMEVWNGWLIMTVTFAFLHSSAHTHTRSHTWPLSPNAIPSWGWKESEGHTMCLASVSSDRLKDRLKWAELNGADWRTSGHYKSLTLSIPPELDSLS